MSLRTEHNFTFMTDDTIIDVAKALRKHVDCDKLDELLKRFPDGALQFWQVE